MRRTCITLFFVGALAAAGCGGSDDTTEVTRPARTTTTEAESPVDDSDAPASSDQERETTVAEDDADDDAAATIELVDPGAEPRQALRLHPAVGVTQELTMRQEMGVEHSGGDGMPTISTRTVTESDLDSEVTAVGDTFEVASTYADARLVVAEPDEVRATTEPLLEELIGQTSITTYSAQGEALETEMALPDTDNPVVDQTMTMLESQADQMSVPFPEDPVGVGAIWERSSRIDMPMGMSMDMTTTLTLLAIDGDHVRARQESRIVMSGSRATDVEGELSGVGFVEWDLSLPTPTSSSMQIEGTITIAMGGVELEQTQTQVMQLTSR